MAPLEAILWSKGKLQILDQLLLPTQSVLLTITSVQQGWEAINTMQVRGAPAIAIVGCLSLAAELHQSFTKSDCSFASARDLHSFVRKSLEHLVTARPTAVNMKTEASKLTKFSQSMVEACSVQEMKDRIIEWCTKLLADDVATNRKLADYGMELIRQRARIVGKDSVSLITICNTGSLATAGYGTALGVVRSLHTVNFLESVFMLETRPYLQGARLSALEAVVEGWPGATLICDGAAGALLATHPQDGAVVGADRVAANGDTANKIGTYQLALLCKAHKVPFYVCTPVSSVDLSLATGRSITIEHRPQEEMASHAGTRVAAPGIRCWNPAFDVTPANLITAIITELGVFSPRDLEACLRNHASKGQ